MYRLTQFLLTLLALGLVACSDGNNGNNSPSGPTAFELAQQDYLQATVDLALRHPEVAEEFSAWLAARS